MKNSIDIKRCLLVFDKVLTSGTQKDGRYQYQGFEAWTDFDGYTCYLSFNDVVVTLMFHSKYDVQFATTESLIKFEKKIQQFEI